MIKKISFVIAISLIFNFWCEHLFAQSESLRDIEVLILKDAYQQAAKECEKILVHHHRSKIRSKVYYLLGICLLKKARYDEARKNFDIILRRFPQSKFCDDASLGIADSYFLAGDYNLASKMYVKFLQHFARGELANIARLHLEQCKQGSRFTSSYFSVQLGSFAKKENAEKLRDKLINGGYQAYILQLPSDGLHRVRVGRFSNRLQAEFLEQRLKTEGYPTKVCP